MSTEQSVQTRIKIIAGDLLAGKTRDAIVTERGKEWQCGNRTVDRYISKAKKISAEVLEKADKIIQETAIETITEAVIGGLRSALEVDKRVQDIIFNNQQLIRTPDVLNADGSKILQKGRVVKVDNTVSDQIRAAGLYYRRHNLLGKEDLTKKKIIVTINGKPRPTNQDTNAGT